MQCSGFVYGMSVAQQYIRTGQYQTILLVGAEVQSTSLDFDHPEGRTMGVLFGDGAGAVVIQAQEGTDRGIRSTHLFSQGEFAEMLWLEEPSSKVHSKVSDRQKLFPTMNGREVFRHAVRRMAECTQDALNATGWTAEEVDLYVPHQANARIAYATADALEVPRDKFFVNINKYGNTTAATIPICFYEAQQEGRLKKGDKVVVQAFGSGFTWASAALVW